MSHRQQAERGGNVPDSREYVHRVCGGITGVSGRDFSRLASPFELCTGTYCAHCRKMVGLDAVAWADTGEAIAAYRRRLWNEAPARKVPPLFWVIVPVAGAALGALFGWLFAPIKARGLVLGPILGAGTAFFCVMPLGNRKNTGIDYRGVR